MVANLNFVSLGVASLVQPGLIRTATLQCAAEADSLTLILRAGHDVSIAQRQAPGRLGPAATLQHGLEVLDLPGDLWPVLAAQTMVKNPDSVVDQDHRHDRHDHGGRLARPTLILSLQNIRSLRENNRYPTKDGRVNRQRQPGDSMITDIQDPGFQEADE